MNPLLKLSVRELAEGYRAGTLSPVDVTVAALERIEETNDALKSFNTVATDIALDRAKRAESELLAGTDLGPMHGVPFAAKDIYDTEGVLTSCQSNLRSTVVPDSNAVSVQRLLDAGAVLLGKTSTIEFATGAPSDETFFPPARNPWDLNCVPGGSSSGSGAAVAAGLTRVALGSDTGGSIRGPAALCGTVGLKPTYGRVSRRGVFPLSYSMDHCGPLSKSVEDSALALGIMAGYDPHDPASANVAVPNFLADIDAGVRGLKLGFVRNWIDDDSNADDEIKTALDNAIELLRARGADIIDVTLPSLDTFHACGRVIVLSECYSIHERTLTSSPHLYGRPTRERLMAGAFINGADYVTATRMRGHLARLVHGEILAGLDGLLAPVSNVVAGRFDDVPDDPMKLGGMVTAPFNVTGSPAMTVGIGFHSSGLPMAMQIAGKPFDEATVLRIGAAYERETPWLESCPALVAN